MYQCLEDDTDLGTLRCLGYDTHLRYGSVFVPNCLPAITTNGSRTLWPRQVYSGSLVLISDENSTDINYPYHGCLVDISAERVALL